MAGVASHDGGQQRDLQAAWIGGRWFDLAFIIAPQLLVAVGVLLWSRHLESVRELPVWLWVVLIVGVDVSHVYSTVFRTYLDPRELRRAPNLYRVLPCAVWAVGVVLYSLNSLLFWRVVAYLAVFHFVRQQYGFMMIYRAKARYGSARIDQLAIYAATVYPLLYWHCYGRDFAWFVAGDFAQLRWPAVNKVGLVLYLGILIAYVGQELMNLLHKGFCHFGKNLHLFGTAVTWWVGIVAFDNDVAFTATNVVAHGVPYLALIWLYKVREAKVTGQKGTFFQSGRAPLYVAVLVFVAFLEEALWDGVVWRDHGAVFFWIWGLMEPLQPLQVLLVPLFIVPQVLHYIFDAVIWRLRHGDPLWSTVLLRTP
jgi:hypothetical protein